MGIRIDVLNNHGLFDNWIVKLDSLGEIQWVKSLGGSENEFMGNIIQTADDGYLLNGGSESNDGDVSGNHGLYDMWVIKLNPLIDNIADLGSNLNNILISPNPFKESTSILFTIKKKEHISIDIFDLNGNCISHLFDEYVNIGTHSIIWNPCRENNNTINSGFYFLKIKSTSFTQTLKLLLLN